MKPVRNTVLASALALALASPAFGETTTPGFERDMALAFEQDGKPMELALLSEQEMRETQGAVWPFSIPWLGRLFWGASWGWANVGYDVYNLGHYSNIRTFYQMAGIQIMAHSLIGLVSVHPFIGHALGWAGSYSFDSVRRLMWQNNWSVFEAINHASALVAQRAADLLRGEGDGSADGDPRVGAPEPMSMSASARSKAFDANKYLVGLLATFPQDNLRQFLSAIPEKTFQKVLSNVAPKATRADVLQRLPPETVSDFLAAMPEDHMPAFRSIVPTRILDSVTSAASALAERRTSGHSGHWRY